MVKGVTSCPHACRDEQNSHERHGNTSGTETFHTFSQTKLITHNNHNHASLQLRGRIPASGDSHFSRTSHDLTYNLPSIITNLSSVAAVVVLAATASMRSIWVRSRAVAAASHCCPVKVGVAGAAFFSGCGLTDECWGFMLLKLRSDESIEVVEAGAGTAF